jgi:hypothetical protein
MVLFRKYTVLLNATPTAGIERAMHLLLMITHHGFGTKYQNGYQQFPQKKSKKTKIPINEDFSKR